MKATLAMTALAVLALAAPTAAQDQSGQRMSAKATMTSADGGELGTVTFDENGNGVLIQAQLSDLPPGEHAFHIHQTGSCEDDFQAAGDHYAPQNNEHGTLNPAGSHAGDLPNLSVAESGEAAHDVITTDVTLAEGAPNTLFDDDGSAVIVHENPDSYQKDAGAGGRIACGVIEPAG